MKTLWILAAAATFAACHNRTQDETGAAPDKGAVKTDTSAMPKPSTGYDTTSTAKPTAPPTSGVDTTSMQPTAPAKPTAPPSSGYDTTSAPSPSAGVGTDTTMSPKAGGTTSDSASTQR